MRPLALLLSPLIAAIGLIAPAAAGATACQDPDVIPTVDRLAPAVLTTICLANEQRAAAGVPQLELDQGLTAVAFGYARRMVAEQFYAHIAPDGTSLADRLAVVGYHPYAAGENMYWGDLHLATPEAAMEGWLGSPGAPRQPARSEVRADRRRHRHGHPATPRPAVGHLRGRVRLRPRRYGEHGSELGPPSTRSSPRLPARSRSRSSRRTPRRRAPGRPSGPRSRRPASATAGHSAGFEDNRFLTSQYRLAGPAGISACVAAFAPVSALPRASELRLTRVRTKGTRATMTVAAQGRRVVMVLRKWNGHWKLDAVAADPD